MWLVQAIISFLVVFALGMLIRWIISKARKPKTSQPVYTAPPPPPAGQSMSYNPPPQAAFCTNCGAKADSGSAFCVKCGKKIS